MRTRRPIFLLALLVAVVTVAVTVPAASGSRGQTTLFDLGGGAFDLPKAQRDGQLEQLQDFGVDTVRVIVPWDRIAPDSNASNKPSFDASDPNAYPPGNWIGLDDLVRGASARGLDVLLTPSTPVPNWASPSNDKLTNPSPGEFQLFVAALGNRYSGTFSPAPVTPTDPPTPVLPRVRQWSVLNEPNLPLFLKPQFKGKKSVAGRTYRELFLAAQRGLDQTGHGADLLLIGETSPGPGRTGTDPITFMRDVFCLNKKFKRKGGCQRIDADGWAQHPYDPDNAPFEEDPNLINLATIGDLTQALNKARGAGAVTRRLPIYVTEYGVESVPDRKFGVSQLRQAEYIGISEYLMYRNGRIRSFGQYLMQDDAGNAQINFQTGLRFSSGGEKVAYDAFPIALVAQRATEKKKKVRVWGHIRPADGSVLVTVRARPGGVVKRIRTNASGYFQFRSPFRKGRRYSASTVLPDGTELTGPFVRTYVFK
jgi:hypothetical protein